MCRVSLDHPWLEFDLGTEMKVLSWAVNSPDAVLARRILWREVRNADLTPECNVEDWLDQELRARNATDAVTFLTSRDISFHSEHQAAAGHVKAHAVATVGLSNAERVGHRVDRSAQDWGTINVAVRLNTGLAESALLEAMSIAVQARTAAVMDLNLMLPSGVATGTGTDCIAIASPVGDCRYAGMHTDIGEAIGHAVYTAVRNGGLQWRSCHRENRNDKT